MKKNKRIYSALATALFVAAIALSLIGFSAFAATESDPTPTVMSKNVSYGSELYLYYAVPASSIPEGETPSLGVYSSNGTTLKYTVTEYSVETVWGRSPIALPFSKISAQAAFSVPIEKCARERSKPPGTVKHFVSAIFPTKKG